MVTFFPQNNYLLIIYSKAGLRYDKFLKLMFVLFIYFVQNAEI